MSALQYVSCVRHCGVCICLFAYVCVCELGNRVICLSEKSTRARSAMCVLCGALLCVSRVRALRCVSYVRALQRVSFVCGTAVSACVCPFACVCLNCATELIAWAKNPHLRALR